jgi:type III secretion protein Q
MNEVQPFMPPRLDTAQVRLDNLAALRRPVLTLGGAAESLVLQLAPLREPGGTALSLTGDDADSIWLRCDSGQLRVQLDAALYARFLRPWIGEEGLEGFPVALAMAAREVALGPLLEVLSGLIGLTIDVAASGFSLGSSSAFLGLWGPGCRDGPPAATMGLDQGAVAALSLALERLPINCIDPDPWPELPIAVIPRLGEVRLTLCELRGLGPGDLLLLPPSSGGDSIPVMLYHCLQPLACARFACHHLTIDYLVSSRMSEATAEAAAATPTVIDADALVIRLDFDLGQQHLPLRELRAMQPGYSFTLEPINRPPVRIMAGEQLIGRGELVIIDDRLGVRVVTLFQVAEPVPIDPPKTVADKDDAKPTA